ncbi:Protein scabrous [Nymphon striatum]|nr:Protein scabrous [Nymphon striatum]
MLDLERQMSKLRLELSEVMERKEAQSDLAVEISELKVQTESLKSDLRKTRQELWQVKDEREKDAEILAKVRINEATIDWTKRVIQELRNELKEISNSERNTSEAMQARQQTTSEILLLKSDLKSMLSKHQELKVAHQHNQARIEQIEQDNVFLRRENQRLAKQQQTFTMQAFRFKQSLPRINKCVTNQHNLGFPNNIYKQLENDEGQSEQLQDDVGLLQVNYRALLQQLQKTISIDESERTRDSDGQNDESLSDKNDTQRTSHRTRHHNHIGKTRRELAQLTGTVNRMQNRQTQLERIVKVLKANFTEVIAAKDEEITNLITLTAKHHQNVSSLHGNMQSLDNIIQTVSKDSTRHSESLKNLTEFTTSVYNLHDSTMQLFNTLEGIDKELTKNIESLQMEVSKVSYNVGQGHASLDVVKQDQISHLEEFQDLRKDMSNAKLKMEKDHIKLTSVQNDLLHSALQKCKHQNKDLTQDVKIVNAESKISKIESRLAENQRDLDIMQSHMKQKIGRSTVDAWKKAYTNLNTKLKETSSELSILEDHYTRLDKEVAHFVYQLPHDCSMKVKDPSLTYGSGVYLIKPIGMPEAVEVFCDMSEYPTDTKRWTVIQKRIDGSENFDRNWQEYKEGFGNRQNEYWIGNEALHYLTDQANYTLRIELWDISDNYSFADYEDFYVSDESTKYRLFISGYSGNATDAMEDHNRHAFSTKGL